MNQESIFRYIGSATLGGGFALGKSLPKSKGDLAGFKTIRMTAIEGEDYDQFERRLIEKLGDAPKRNREIRARQLKALIEKFTNRGKSFIIIITKAHLLKQRIIRCFKGVHEFGDGAGTYPGFIFLGNVEKIMKVLKKEKSIELRTTLLPGALPR